VEIEERFRPLPKHRQLALMPRRRREDLLGAVQLIRRSGRLDGWEFVLIDGMTQAEVAEALGEAAIFLFGAEREGFGLPGAEAMAAGCYVVGFTGDGAKEYMLPDCCSVVPDSDVVAMADLTLAAMEQFDHDRQTLQGRVDIGRDRVLSRHSSVRVRAALAEVFGELTREASPALMTKAATLPHYQAHGPRYGQLGAAYRGARHTARRLADRINRSAAEPAR
jgi:glycosyltransferase involved in cell wall biosynthesis